MMVQHRYENKLYVFTLAEAQIYVDIDRRFIPTADVELVAIGAEYRLTSLLK